MRGPATVLAERRVQCAATMPRRRSPARAGASDAASPTWWRRPEGRFLVTFGAVLAAAFTLLSWAPVNDRLVEPFTGLVARASGVGLRALGEEVVRTATVLRGPRFAVNVRNGCNGIEAMVILLAAIVAFPAGWKDRGRGLLLGASVLQAVNLVRVMALYLTGAYLPHLFDASHTLLWQSIVILCAVVVWLLWAQRLSRPAAAAA